MKHHLTRAAALLAMTAVLLTGSASALFFGKKTEEPDPGAPQAEDLSLSTYRDVPGQGRFQAADPEGDEWLMNLLAGWSGEDPQVLAGLILQESVRREKLRDDCAIQVLYRPASGARAV